VIFSDIWAMENDVFYDLGEILMANVLAVLLIDEISTEQSFMYVPFPDFLFF
jgi:hypothetical protein